MGRPGNCLRLDGRLALGCARLFIAGYQLDAGRRMGGGLGGIVKRQFVSQSPAKHAKRQRQERYAPDDVDWANFMPTIHSHYYANYSQSPQPKSNSIVYLPGIASAHALSD